MNYYQIFLLLSQKLLPMLYALIGFGALIAIHEFGHFLFCKLFKIHTPTFSIGFGPELVRKKIGQTQFRLALIPLGGYCEIVGLAEIGQGEQLHAHDTNAYSFDTKSFWQKILVLSGGIIFNLLFAYSAFFAIFMIGSTHYNGLYVSKIVASSLADRQGVIVGDVITHINDVALLPDEKNGYGERLLTIFQEIVKNPTTSVVDLIVQRGDTNISLSLPMIDVSPRSIGVEIQGPLLKQPFFTAIKSAIRHTNYWIVATIVGMKKFFTHKSLDGAGGPVMILNMSFNAAKRGVVDFLTLLALISINLAILNLLPLGALDGGQILFTVIEVVIRRKIPLVVRNGVNLISWVIFIGLAIFLTYKDVATLCGAHLEKLYIKIKTLIA